MSCLEVAPTNPISSLIVSALGPNYFPPYDLNFQPIQRDKLVEDKFLKLNTPGGGKLKPIGDPKHTHISEYVTPISGLLGSVFAFFGPLFIILDVIRALIDIICSLFNPVPLILTVVDLFINVVPPLIALYPPLSSILHALNAVKVIVSIAGGLISSLIPVIESVVNCALEIPMLLSEGRIEAIQGVSVKICELLQEFKNVIAGFAPIKFIIELVELFIGMGAKFFCVGAPFGDSPCCTVENCPPIIINPPGGDAEVLQTVYKLTLKDLFDLLFDQINPTLETVSDFLNDVLPGIIDPIISLINDGIAVTLNAVVEAVQALLGAVNNLVGGLLTPLIENLPLDQISGVAIPPFPTIDLTLTAPEGFDKVVIIQPTMFLEFKSAVSLPNENGLVSQVGIGHEYSSEELASLQDYIIPPNLIPIPLPKLPEFLGGQADDEEEDDPATIRLRLTDKDTGESVIASAIFQFPTMQQVATRLRVSVESLSNLFNTLGFGFLPLNALGVIQVFDDSFDPNTELEYEVIPDQVELLKNNLIGLGCQNDIQAASQALFQAINADVQALPPGVNALDPVITKIGLPFPQPPEEELEELLEQLSEDPTQPVDPLPIINRYLNELAEFSDALLCIGASSIQSTFTASKPYVIANNKDFSVLALTVKDAGGNNLITGGLIPGSDIRAQFKTNLGDVGPVELDVDSGTFFATIKSDTVGVAEITAQFLVRDKICMTSANFADLEVSEQRVRVEFIPEPTAFPRVRKTPQYVQSRGGRRRR